MARQFWLLDHPNPSGNQYNTTRNTCQHGFSGDELPHLIVIHTGENNPDFNPPDDAGEQLAGYAAGKRAQVSWHATTDSDSIIWMLPASYRAWHVRSFNNCGYGIEQATKADMWVNTPWKWREAILRNTARVVAAIATEHNIPLKWLTRAEIDAGERGVCSHAILDPTRRHDPGRAYPYAWMLERAAEYQAASAAPAPTPVEPPAPAGTLVMGPPEASLAQAKTWAVLKGVNSVYSPETLREIAAAYYSVGLEYGVRPDLALAMSAKETGYWRFGGDVKPEQWNFAGIGATGGVPGLTFPSIEAGVRAHVLRMRMYAVNDSSYYDVSVLGRALPSSHWGKYPTIEEFNGVWAVPGTTYGQSIVGTYLASLKDTVPESPPTLTVEQRVADLERRVTALETK